MIIKRTIRTRLLLLTGTLLTLLILSNLYMRNQIHSSNNKLQIQIESANTTRQQQFSAHNKSLTTIEKTVDDLRIISGAIKAFGDLKYWLTDLQSSWLVESESNAKIATEKLKSHLTILAPQFPIQVTKIHKQVDSFTVSTFKAVDAYIDGNRVLGNSLQAKTRRNIIAVDTTLTQLNEKIRQDSLTLHNKIRQEHITVSERLRIEGVQTKKEALATFETATTINVSILFAATLIASIFTWLILLSINRPLAQITNALKSLAKGDLTVDVPARERRDEIGTMAQAAQVFKEASQKTVDQNWIQSNTADISGAIQHAHSRTKAAAEILSRLVPLLGGGHGLFYHYDDVKKHLELQASYAHTDPQNLNKRFALGEGVAGQCGLKQKPITLHNLPDDYIRIHSGLGEAAPNTIIAIPLLLQNKLRGVIEVASFKHFSPRQQQLLNEIVPVVALYMDNLEKSEQTQQLLRQTQKQANTLRESEAELKLREEELNATNEELRQQTDILRQQAVELEASEEELQATNKELLEKTLALEEQQGIRETAQEQSHIKLTDTSLPFTDNRDSINSADKTVLVIEDDLKFAHKKVLVVDDDMRSAFALSKALRAKGLSVEIAKDGESALAKLNSLPDVDLVLMDMMMPGMDGFEATRQIRKQQRFLKLPVIAVTAKAMLGDREACLEAGTNDYLSKPVDIEKLLSIICAWI